MIELFKNPNYDFIGKRKWAYLASVVFTLIGLGALAFHGGLRYDLDFTGGTLIQVQFEKPPTVAAIRRSLGTIHLGESVIQEFGDNREYIIRMPLVENVGSDEISRRVQAALAAEQSLGKFQIRRVEFVGPQVGRELQLQAVYLVLGGLVWIAIYLAWRFDLRGGHGQFPGLVYRLQHAEQQGIEFLTGGIAKAPAGFNGDQFFRHKNSYRGFRFTVLTFLQLLIPHGFKQYMHLTAYINPCGGTNVPTRS